MGIMNLHRSRPVARAVFILLVSGGLAAQARAQNTDLQSASVLTCNVKGSVTLTIAGNSTHYPVICANPTGQESPGNDSSALAGTTTLGVPAVANVASISAPYGESTRLDSPGTTALTGEAGASDVSLAQGGVAAHEVSGRLSCISTSGGPALDCAPEMTIGALQIDGQNVPIPQPVPANTQIPVGNLSIQVQLPVVGAINVPVSGVLTLNKFRTIGEGTSELQVEHAPLSLSLSGGIHVSGLGLMSLTIDLDDYESVSAYCQPTFAITPYTVNFCP